MRRAGWALLLLATACGDSGGEGGGSSWQPGLEPRPPTDGQGGATYQPPRQPGPEPRCDWESVGSPCTCPGPYDGKLACSGDAPAQCRCPSGVCGTNFAWELAEADACTEDHCCAGVARCLGAGEDDRAACYACLNDGGGAACDALLACIEQHGCFDDVGGSGGSGGGGGAEATGGGGGSGGANPTSTSGGGGAGGA